jgi:hypothetical protein
MTTLAAVLFSLTIVISGVALGFAIYSISVAATQRQRNDNLVDRLVDVECLVSEHKDRLDSTRMNCDVCRKQSENQLTEALLRIDLLADEAGGEFYMTDRIAAVPEVSPKLAVRKKKIKS